MIGLWASVAQLGFPRITCSWEFRKRRWPRSDGLLRLRLRYDDRWRTTAVVVVVVELTEQVKFDSTPDRCTAILSQDLRQNGQRCTILVDFIRRLRSLLAKMSSYVLRRVMCRYCLFLVMRLLTNGWMDGSSPSLPTDVFAVLFFNVKFVKSVPKFWGLKRPVLDRKFRLDVFGRSLRGSEEEF